METGTASKSCGRLISDADGKPPRACGLVPNHDGYCEGMGPFTTAGYFTGPRLDVLRAELDNPAERAARERRRATIASVYHNASLAAWDGRWNDARSFAATAEQLIADAMRRSDTWRDTMAAAEPEAPRTEATW